MTLWELWYNKVKKRFNYLPRNKDNIEYAKKMRKEMTKQEKHLWFDFLKDYPIRFKRQEIIGNYIIDFYCVKTKLAIEIDGEQHYTTKQTLGYDKKRTAFLNSYNIPVLRFSNFEINQHFRGVCETIDSYVMQRLQSFPKGKVGNPPADWSEG